MKQNQASFPTGLRWYVVRTNPRKEERAKFYLDQHGIRTFLPWLETVKRDRRDNKDRSDKFSLLRVRALTIIIMQIEAITCKLHRKGVFFKYDKKTC